MRWLRMGGLVSVLALLIVFAGKGLRAGFTHDDLMNLSRALSPARELARALVFFWQPADSFRPAGSILYRMPLGTFGLNPLPYRMACYGLPALDLFLAYLVALRLSEKRLAAWLTAAMLAYHREFWAFYINTGFCFDLLAFAFYFAALALFLDRPLTNSRRHCRCFSEC